MKTKLFLLSALCAGAALVSSCADALTIPPARTEIPYDQLESDRHGQFYFKLEEDQRLVQYDGFRITLPKTNPYRIFLRLNSDQHAELRINPDNWGGMQLSCDVQKWLLSPNLLPKTFDAEALQTLCVIRYGRSPSNQKFSVNPAEWKGMPAAEYVMRYLPNGESMYLLQHGFLVFSPADPGLVYDIFYVQTEEGGEARQVRELGEDFLQKCVEIEHERKR